MKKSSSPHEEQVQTEIDNSTQKLQQETTHQKELETQLAESKSLGKKQEIDAATAAATAAAVADASDASARYSRILIEVSLDPLVTIGSDGKVTDVNLATEKVTGYSRKRLIGNDFADYFTEPDRAREGYRRVFAKGSVCDYPLVIKHKSGRLTDVLYNATVYMNEAGEVEGVFAAARDVTAVKKAEANAHLQGEVIRNMSEGVHIIKCADNTIVYTNPRFEKMFGYGPGEMIGKDESIVNAPTDKTPEETKEDIIGVLEKTGEWHGEVKNIRKDGTQFWCYANVSLYDHPKYEEVYITVHSDITKRKEAESALRESETRYRTIVNNVNDALIIHDFKGRIIDINENACRFLGYTRKELIGRNLASIDSEESAKLIKERMARIIADGMAVFESLEVKKDGSLVPVEVSAKLISGEGTGLVQAFVRDITKRKQAEKEQARSYRKLEETLQGTVNAITAISSMRDPYTSGHEVRVSNLVVAIANEMGFPNDKIDELRIISVLHDIGKICVPSEILSKPGRLTDVEFDLIKMHSRVGYDIVKEAALPCNVAKTILQHHERLDGSGYPNGIKKDKMNQDARILAVADVVEAMNSHRPYRSALGIDAALEEISKNRDVLYDPDVVDACVRLFKEKNFKFKN